MLFVTGKEFYAASYFKNVMTLVMLKLRVLIEHYNKNRSKIAKKKKKCWRRDWKFKMRYRLYFVINFYCIRRDRVFEVRCWVINFVGSFHYVRKDWKFEVRCCYRLDSVINLYYMRTLKKFWQILIVTFLRNLFNIFFGNWGFFLLN